MCYGCFQKYTDEPVVNDRVLALVDLLENAGDAAHWGYLHIIVEDDNLDDYHFDLSDPDNKYMADEYPKAEQWERDIFDAYAELTEPERATANGIHDGYISRDGRLIVSARSNMTLDGGFTMIVTNPETRLRLYGFDNNGHLSVTGALTPLLFPTDRAPAGTPRD